MYKLLGHSHNNFIFKDILLMKANTLQISSLTLSHSSNKRVGLTISSIFFFFHLLPPSQFFSLFWSSASYGGHRGDSFFFENLSQRIYFQILLYQRLFFLKAYISNLSAMHRVDEESSTNLDRRLHQAILDSLKLS